MKTRRPLTTALVFTSALLVNPLAACGDADDDFDYSEQEMVDTVAGRYTGFIEGGEATRTEGVVLEITQAANADAGPQKCGNRTIVASAEACISMTEMAVQVTLTRPGGAGPLVGGGMARAFANLDTWEVEANLGGKTTLACSGDAEGNLSCDDPAGTGRFVLVRAR